MCESISIGQMVRWRSNRVGRIIALANGLLSPDARFRICDSIPVSGGRRLKSPFPEFGSDILKSRQGNF